MLLHRLANLNNELDALKRERAVVAQQSESTKTAVAEVTAKYEKELARVSALQKRTVRPSAGVWATPSSLSMGSTLTAGWR